MTARVLRTLKELIDTTPANFVLVGTDEFCFNVVSLRLLDNPIVASLDRFENDSEYSSFIERITSPFPAKCRALVREPVQSIIFERTGGWPGRTILAVKRAAALAVKEGTSAVKQKHIEDGGAWWQPVPDPSILASKPGRESSSRR